MARRRAKNNGAMEVAGGVLGGVALVGVLGVVGVIGGGYWLYKKVTRVPNAAREYLKAQGYKPMGKFKQMSQGGVWTVETEAIPPGGTQPQPITLIVDRETLDVYVMGKKNGGALAKPNWGWRTR
jgi:hypothetical protein